MGQIRAFDYGSNYSHDKHVSLIHGTCVEGVYQDFNITVTDSNVITVGPGSAVFSPGLHIEETESAEITVTSPEEPTVYTVVYWYSYQHILGGTQARLTVEEENLATVEDGLILGWIAHPGGGVKFDQGYVTLSKRYRLDYVLDEMVPNSEIVLLPPYNWAPVPPHALATVDRPDYEPTRLVEGVWYAGVISHFIGRGAGLDIRWETMYTMPIHLPFSRRPLFLDIKTKSSYGAETRVRLFDTNARAFDDFVFTVVGSGNEAWTETTFEIPYVTDAAWAKGGIFTLQFNARIKPLEWAKLAYMKLRFFR